jgi:hypothetical protein
VASNLLLVPDKKILTVVQKLFRRMPCQYTNMNAPAAGNALNSSSLPVMKKRSIARNAVKPRFVSWSVVPDFWEIHRQLNADPARHRVFPEPADNVAAVR